MRIVAPFRIVILAAALTAVGCDTVTTPPPAATSPSGDPPKITAATSPRSKVKKKKEPGIRPTSHPVPTSL